MSSNNSPQRLPDEHDPFDDDYDQVPDEQSNVTYLAPFSRTKLFQSDDFDDILAMQQQFMASRQAPSALLGKSTINKQHFVNQPQANSTTTITTTTTSTTTTTTTTKPTTNSTAQSPSLNQFELVDMFLGHTPGFEDVIKPQSDGNTKATIVSQDDEDWFNEQPEDFLPNRGRMGGAGNIESAPSGSTRHANDGPVSLLPVEYLKEKKLQQEMEENNNKTQNKPQLATTFKRISTSVSPQSNNELNKEALYKPAGFGSYLTKGFEIKSDMPENYNKSTTDNFNSTQPLPSRLNQATTMTTKLAPAVVTITDTTTLSQQQQKPHVSTLGSHLTKGNAQVTTSRSLNRPTTLASPGIDDDDNNNIVVKVRQRPNRRGPQQPDVPQAEAVVTLPAPQQPQQPQQPLTTKLPTPTTSSFEHQLPTPLSNDEDQIPSGLIINSDTIKVGQLAKNNINNNSTTLSPQQQQQQFNNPRNFLAGMDVSFTRPIPTVFKEDMGADLKDKNVGVEQQTGGQRLDLGGQVVQRQRPRGPRGPVGATVPSTPVSNDTKGTKPSTITPGSSFAQQRALQQSQQPKAVNNTPVQPKDSVSKYDTGEAFRLKDTLPTYIPKESSYLAMKKIVDTTVKTPLSPLSDGLDDIDTDIITTKDDSDSDDGNDNGDIDYQNIGVSKGEIDSTVQMLLQQMQSMGANGSDYLSEALVGWSPERIEAFRNRKNPKHTQGNDKASSTSTTTTTTTTTTTAGKSKFAQRNNSQTSKNNEVESFLKSIDSSSVNTPATSQKVLTKRETELKSDVKSNNRSIDEDFQNAELYRSILSAHNRPEEQRHATQRVINIGGDHKNDNNHDQVMKYSGLAQKIEPWELIPSLRAKYSNAIDTASLNSTTANKKRNQLSRRGINTSAGPNRFDANSWLTPISLSENSLINHHQVPTGNNGIYLLSQISTKNQSANNKAREETATNLQLYQRLRGLFHITQNINHQDSSYIALTTQLTDLRFDLEGKVVQPFFTQHFGPLDQSDLNNITSQRELYHHGNQPHRAGYTIDELVLYLRSTYQNQISLALRTVNSIIVNARAGLYYNFVVDYDNNNDSGDDDGADGDDENDHNNVDDTDKKKKNKETFIHSTPSVSSWVTNNISSTILETILIREIPQLCLYLLINNQHGYQNQLNHNSTLVYYTLAIISSFLTPKLTPRLTPPPNTPLLPNHYEPIIDQYGQRYNLSPYSVFNMMADSLQICDCHLYSNQNSSNTLLLHFITSPSSSTLPNNLRLPPSTHPLSPLHSSNLAVGVSNDIKTITPRFHTALDLICPSHTNPYINKGYYTHTDTPHYIQRYLQSLYFEFTHPKLIAMSQQRDIPLSLIATLNEEEIAKNLVASGKIQTDKSPAEQRVQLYSLLSQEKRSIYLHSSHHYAEKTKFCVERGNKHFGLDTISTNQLFLYDLVIGTLSIGTLSQLVILLQYYTYFTNPSLLASLFKSRSTKTKNSSQQLKTLDELDAMMNSGSSDISSRHSQFYSVQVTILDILISLAKHSHTAASIVSCTDGLLSLLAKFLSVPALMSVINTPQFITPTQSPIHTESTQSQEVVNPIRIALEKRLLMVVQLLLHCGASHPIILNEIDQHINGSIISYLTVLTTNSMPSENNLINQTVSSNILEQINILNPILWLISSIYNGGSTILPLSLFDFNSNNIYILYRSINNILAIVLDFITTSTTSGSITMVELCQRYQGLPLLLSRLYSLQSQLHLYIVSHIDEEEHHAKLEIESTKSLIQTAPNSAPEVLLKRQQFKSVLTSIESFEEYIVGMSLQTHHPQKSFFITTNNIAIQTNTILERIGTVSNTSDITQINTSIAQWTRFTVVLGQFYKANDNTNTNNCDLVKNLNIIYKQIQTITNAIKSSQKDGTVSLLASNNSTILNMVELHHAYPTQMLLPQSQSSPFGSVSDLLSEAEKLYDTIALYPSLINVDEGIKPDSTQAFINQIDTITTTLNYYNVIFNQFLIHPDVILHQEMNQQDSSSSQPIQPHPLTHFVQNNMFFNQYGMNSVSNLSHSEANYIAQSLLHLVAIFTQAMHFFTTESNENQNKLILDHSNDEHKDIFSKQQVNDLYHSNSETDLKLAELFALLHRVVSISFPTAYFITHLLVATNHQSLALQCFIMILCNINIISFLSQYPTTTSPLNYVYLQRLLVKYVPSVDAPVVEDITNEETNVQVDPVLQSRILTLLDQQNLHADKVQTLHDINLQTLHHTVSELLVINMPVFSIQTLPGTPATYFTPLPHLTSNANKVSLDDPMKLDVIGEGDETNDDNGSLLKPRKHDKSVDLNMFSHCPEFYTMLTSTFGQFTNVILPEELLTSSVFPPAPQHIISHPCLLLPDTVSTPASLRAFVIITNLISVGFSFVIPFDTKNKRSNITSTTHEMIFKNELFYLFATLSTQPYLLENFSNDLINDTYRKKSPKIEHELIPQWLYQTFFISTFLSYSRSTSLSISSVYSPISTPLPFINLNWILFYNLTTIFEQVLSSFVENGENIIFIYFLILLVTSPVNGQVFKAFGSPITSTISTFTNTSVNGKEDKEDKEGKETNNSVDYMTLSTPSKNETLQFTTALTLTILDVFPNLLTQFHGKSLLLVPSFERQQEVVNNKFKFEQGGKIYSVVPYINPLMLSSPIALSTSSLSIPDQNTHNTRLPIIIPINFTNPAEFNIHGDYTIDQIGYSLSFVKALAQILAHHAQRNLLTTSSSSSSSSSSTLTETFPAISKAILEPIIATVLVSAVLSIDPNNNKNNKCGVVDDLTIQKAALVFQALFLSLEPKETSTDNTPQQQVIDYQSHPLYVKLILADSSSADSDKKADITNYTIKSHPKSKSTPSISPEQSQKHLSNLTLIRDLITTSPQCTDGSTTPHDVYHVLYSVYIGQCYDIISQHHELLSLEYELLTSTNTGSSTTSTTASLTNEYHRAIETLFTMMDVLVELDQEE